MAPSPLVLHESECELESWNEATRERVVWRTLFSGERTPTRGLTMGVAELPPGMRETVTHRHDPVEAYYVLSGEGVVFIDGEPHPVRAGSAVYLPSRAEHGALNTGAETLRLLYVFAADSFDEVEYEFSRTPRSIE